MTIVLRKNATKKEVEAAKKKLSKGKTKKGNLSEFFGALKHGVDGLEYQKKVRSEWD